MSSSKAEPGHASTWQPLVEDWLPVFPRENPALAQFCPQVLDVLASCREFPPVDQWAALRPQRGAGSQAPAGASFVPQDERAVRAAGGYDFYIRDTGSVPSRPGSWHDLFNALIWSHYPRTKRAIHQLQLTDHATRRDPARRTPLGDVATLLDECGVVMLSTDPTLFDDLRGLRWRRLFYERRAELAVNARFLVVGHALLHAMLNPYIGLMGHALLLPADDDALASAGATRDFVDHWSEQCLAAAVQRTSDLKPLPLLGVPGYARNDSPAFYDGLPEYFRTTRRPKA